MLRGLREGEIEPLSGKAALLKRNRLQKIDALPTEPLRAFPSNGSGPKSPEVEQQMLYRTIKPLIVDATQVTEPAEVKTESGVLRLKAGDWLVRDPQGNVTRCDNVDFQCTYASLKSTAPIEELHESKPCGC
jgi:hypothetical protein